MVHLAIDEPAVIAAMVHDLHQLDLTAFRVRARPKTAEQGEQKLRSLSGFNRFWLEVLQSESFPVKDSTLPPHLWDGAEFVSTSALRTSSRHYETGIRQFAP